LFGVPVVDVEDGGLGFEGNSVVVGMRVVAKIGTARVRTMMGCGWQRQLMVAASGEGGVMMRSVRKAEQAHRLDLLSHCVDVMTGLMVSGRLVQAMK